MDVKNIFNKVKSVVTEFIDSQKTKSQDELEELRQAALLAQDEQEKKVTILHRLLSDYPEEMAKMFWEISAKHETWGELSESPDVAALLEKHITFSKKKSLGNPYSQMLAGSHGYWTATDLQGLEHNVSFEVINLQKTDTLELIKGISHIYKLEKIDTQKPALLVYYFFQKEQIIPHFHFVE